MTLCIETLPDRLRTELGADAVLADADVTVSYARDMMPLASYGAPLAVVVPTSVGAGGSAHMRGCTGAIVPRGAGSGLSDAANAIEGCVVLVRTKLNEIPEVDPDGITGWRVVCARCGEPGFWGRGGRARAALSARPFRRMTCASSAGNLATNAGGLCCVKYSVATDAVLGLKVVLADG